MDKLIMSNKMIDPKTENKIRIKFNVAMHGFGKDQTVKYSSLPASKKILVRRRLSDNDNSVEILETLQKTKAVKNSYSRAESTANKNLSENK